MVSMLKDVKAGEVFKLVRGGMVGTTVYVRGEYVRECKKFSATKWNDTNCERLLKGTTIVHHGFTF